MISVIIPVYNAERYVAETLESVLEQSLKPAEIIVINDGSTDNTLEVLKKYSPYVRLVSRENRGASATLNESLGLASQPLIAFLDADDIWTPDKLERQKQHLDQNPQLEGCFGYMQPFVSPELPEPEKQQILCPAEPLPGVVAKSTLMVRREVFVRVGLFSTEFQVDFPEWIIRAREAGFRYELLPEVVLYRRLHRTGLSSHSSYKSDMSRILKASLDRKRTLNG
ncbi:glycosyltransferase family A protein [Telluribacter sp.]|jgi:glycosyltransferase involved in cell wall biosynthesis|uniref:glycosyltransferase family 2 protein n=1 Tax=Telluribacter sp. TaxID=1978767 RepID=UPI002E0E6F9E|nr:glycosyltransferase family A protein [Telluribacter sp.]